MAAYQDQNDNTSRHGNVKGEISTCVASISIEKEARNLRGITGREEGERLERKDTGGWRGKREGGK